MQKIVLERHAEEFHCKGLVGLAGTVAALLLASCGGGGGGDAASALELRNGPAEFLRCEVPEQISIVHENEGAPGWKTNRYLQFSGQALAKVMPAPGLETAKNPEGIVSHGPSHAQNCTPGAGALQTVSFRVRSQGFYGSEVGDHLAFGLRANSPTFNALGNEKYDGIGVILHKVLGGVIGERFGYPGGNNLQPVTLPQVDLADDTIYRVEMQADTTFASYRVTVEASGQSTGWKNYVQPADFAPLQGTGLIFAFLCRDNNGRCEAFDSAFRVDIFDISAGWR
jgi:hypothetical protein